MKPVPILIAGLVLGAFAIVGVTLVAVTHAATVDRIAANDRMTMLKKLEAIVPPGSIGNDPIADRIEVQAQDLLGTASTNVYRVRKDGEAVALVLNPVVPDGYAGPIKLLVAVMKDGSSGRGASGLPSRDPGPRRQDRRAEDRLGPRLHRQVARRPEPRSSGRSSATAASTTSSPGPPSPLDPSSRPSPTPCASSRPRARGSTPSQRSRRPRGPPE